MFQNGKCPTCSKCEVLEKYGDKYLCINCIVKLNFAMSDRKIANSPIDKLKEYIKKYNSNDYKLITDGRTHKFVVYTKEEQELDKNYKPLLDEHNKFYEQTQMLYYDAISKKSIDNQATKKCIQLCLEDIELANKLKEYEIKKVKFDKDYCVFYSTFFYLIMLYEKLGQIDDAIIMCKKANEMNFIIDNTKSGTAGRLARLLKKKDKIYN
ncbi:MAG: hypothetical protein HFJ12_01350 [Bacilli bacterium]|nr:hypothetical protein [Bacilli bacterium]